MHGDGRLREDGRVGQSQAYFKGGQAAQDALPFGDGRRARIRFVGERGAQALAVAGHAGHDTAAARIALVVPEGAHARVGVAFRAVVAVAVAQCACDGDDGQRLAAGRAALVDGDEEQGVVLDGAHRVEFPAQPAQEGRIAFVGLVDVLNGSVAQPPLFSGITHSAITWLVLIGARLSWLSGARYTSRTSCVCASSGVGVAPAPSPTTMCLSLA